MSGDRLLNTLASARRPPSPSWGRPEAGAPLRTDLSLRFRETGFCGAETAASKRPVTFNRSSAETKPPHENPAIRRYLHDTGKSLSNFQPNDYCLRRHHALKSIRFRQQFRSVNRVMMLPRIMQVVATDVAKSNIVASLSRHKALILWWGRELYHRTASSMTYIVKLL
jgi:hypothetical protein